MADQMNQSTEENGSSSDDDELNKGGFCWDMEQYEKNANTNNGDDDDWSIFDDDDNHNEITHHHNESSNLRDLDWWEIPYYMDKMDEIPTTRYDRQKASHYKGKFLSLRRHLTDNNLFLRPAYKGTGYHIYTASDFQPKVSQFMARTDVYSLVNKISRSYPHTSQNCLADIVNRVEITLTNLFHSKSITEVQYKKMNINRSMVRMHYLYFVADTYKEGIPIQPIMVCNDGPTIGISCYLGHLLGSLFNEATHCRTFDKEVDVIHAMKFYAENGHLQPTTLFASFNIDELCITFSHQEAIIALEHFLHDYASDHLINDMNIDTIIQLVRLVLENQYFIHNYKLYRQTTGNASGSMLTIPLVYIYIFYWQKNLMDPFINKNELFGRYRDEAFITWNQSADQLCTLLSMANSQFPQTMWLNTSIGTKIHFRNIELGQQHGVLSTSVYHELTTEDDILSEPLRDVIQCPIQDTLKWVRTALYNATRYSSDDDAYDEEKLIIQSTLERNGFPEIVFNDAYDEFIRKFAVNMRYPPFNRYNNHQTFRQQVLRYDTNRTLKQKEQSIQQNIVLHLPYTPHWDSAAIADFQQDLNNLLKDNFGDHPRMKDFSIKILQHRCYSLPVNDLLIKKRPDKAYLVLSDIEQKKNNI